jgi:hypothetical protein
MSEGWKNLCLDRGRVALACSLPGSSPLEMPRDAWKSGAVCIFLFGDGAQEGNNTNFLVYLIYFDHLPSTAMVIVC